MTKRNSYLDVAKFLFSIIIILYHFGFFFHGGYIVVEAFFMISGYFMMRSLAKDKGELSSGVATARFVTHKYKSIVFFLIPSAILGCIAYLYIIPRDTEAVFMQAVLMIFEIVPMQVAGFTGFFTTGVSWYLSALFLALLVIYPLAHKFRENFTLSICPLIAILIYGYLSIHCGNLDVPNSWIANLFNSGMLRGVAGVSAGCFLYECSTRLERKCVSILGKIFFAIIEIGGWAFCIFCMNKYPRSFYDSAMVMLMFGLLLIGINRYSLLSYLIQFKCTKYLANVSMVIYMNHYYWNMYLNTQYPELSRNIKFWIYLALVAVSSTVVFCVGRLFMLLWDRQMNKQNFVKQ